MPQGLPRARPWGRRRGAPTPFAPFWRDFITPSPVGRPRTPHRAPTRQKGEETTERHGRAGKARALPPQRSSRPLLFSSFCALDREKSRAWGGVAGLRERAPAGLPPSQWRDGHGDEDKRRRRNKPPSEERRIHFMPCSRHQAAQGAGRKGALPPKRTDECAHGSRTSPQNDAVHQHGPNGATVAAALGRRCSPRAAAALAASRRAVGITST